MKDKVKLRFVHKPKILAMKDETEDEVKLRMNDKVKLRMKDKVKLRMKDKVKFRMRKTQPVAPFAFKFSVLKSLSNLPKGKVYKVKINILQGTFIELHGKLILEGENYVFKSHDDEFSLEIIKVE